MQQLEADSWQICIWYTQRWTLRFTRLCVCARTGDSMEDVLSDAVHAEIEQLTAKGGRDDYISARNAC